MIESNNYGAEHVTYEEVEQVFEQCSSYCGKYFVRGILIQTLGDKEII
jgi:hypothetical protein